MLMFRDHARTRRGWTGLALSAVVAIGAIGALGACGDDDDDGGGANDGGGGEAAGAPLPIGEVRTFEVTSNNHVDVVVDYEQTPPVGGDHAPVWQNCGFYEEPIFSEAAVHSLEHGAVWITYRPDLPAEQVDQIRALAEQPYTLASPWTEGELGAPIVLSAWGAQLALESLPDPAADEFLTTYRAAGTAPEPGAPCTGGTSQTRSS
jgi:hypothetical protein